VIDMLNDIEFWKRVKRIEGKTVTTLVRRIPRKILKVTDDHVFVEGRMKPICFHGEWGLFSNYQILHKDKYLRFGDNASGYSLSYSIILSVVPYEAEEDDGGISIKIIN
jgi:hypothetical protein